MSKDYYKNERIELAREKVRKAETLEDIALVVTHEGLGLLSHTLENSMRRIIQEEIQKATKELALGFLKGMEPVKQLPEPEKPRYDYKEFAAESEPEKRTPKKRTDGWTDEEDEDLLNQFTTWKEKMSENKALEQVSIPGRTTGAIKFRYRTILRGKHS